MKKLYALLFLVVSATFPLFSQSESDHHPKWVDYTGTHEVDVSVGFPTARIMVSIMEMGRGFMWLNNLAGDILGHGISGRSAAEAAVYRVREEAA